MGTREGMVSANPRGQIDNRLKLIQEDLDSVEKQLGVIVAELLGPLPVPDDRAEVEKTKAGGWLNQVVLKLDDFRKQLGRIKGLEKDLKKSIIGSFGKMLAEQEKPTEE